MKKKILFIFSFILLVILICYFFRKEEHQVNEICEFEVYRFEQDFFNIKPDSFDIVFPILKVKYPSFFTDTILDFKRDVFLNDTLRSIFDSVQLYFADEIIGIEEIQRGFCNYQKYFPSESFSLYTYIEGAFDYRYPVVFSDGKLFVDLELFLGSNHSFYSSLPDYIKFGHDVDFLPSSCFVTLAGRHVPIPKLDNFLSSILHYAKAYFFAQHMLVEIEEFELFKCSKEKIDWCKNNEKVIWEYMIENEYLFSSSPELIERFVSLAPFSKFGLDIDVHSPGGVGVWLGLQILNAYSKNNNITLVELLNETDYLKILNKSGYKP